MYILLVYKKELFKNDYLKTLLITSIKSLKKKLSILIYISRGKVTLKYCLTLRRPHVHIVECGEI